MNIDFLRQIGCRLFKEISSKKPQFNSTALGKGASGDITFPVDKLAEDVIIESFDREGFKINVIAEERGIRLIENSDITLIIDPIDGSKNAVSGIPFFSTSVAIADGKKIKNLKTGYIINLINGDEFYAERGRGAFFNGHQIRTQLEEKPVIIAFEASNPYSSLQGIFPLFKLASRVRCYGSTALDLAYLSMGALSIFVTPTASRIFDFSAGVLIAKEAGALITDLEGQSIDELEVDFGTKTTLLVCGNERLQEKAIKTFKIK